MSLSATNGEIWGDLTTTYLISKYLQRPIHVWNKLSKCIMAKGGVYYIGDSLHIAFRIGPKKDGYYELIDYI